MCRPRVLWLFLASAIAIQSVGCACPPPPKSAAEAPGEPKSATEPPAEPEPAEPEPAEPEPAEPEPAEAPGAQGEPCGRDGTCDQGLQCVRYYGIAGAKGPEFTSCELRCKGDSGCPNGQTCATIADGPGQVCRPTRQ